MTSAADTPSSGHGYGRSGCRGRCRDTVTEPSALSVISNLVGMAGQRLIDGVVDDLVDHVVEARAVVGVADIHARPFANRIEALEDLDRIRAS